VRLDVLLPGSWQTVPATKLANSRAQRRSAARAQACSSQRSSKTLRIAVAPSDYVARQRYQPALASGVIVGSLPGRGRSFQVPPAGRRQRPARRIVAPSGEGASSCPTAKESMVSDDREQPLSPLHSTCRLASGARNDRQPFDLLIGHRQLDPCRHPAMMPFLDRSNPKRGIHKTNHRVQCLPVLMESVSSSKPMRGIEFFLEKLALMFESKTQLTLPTGPLDSTASAWC